MSGVQWMAGLLLLAAPAAQAGAADAPAGAVVRLSPEQIDAIEAEAAARAQPDTDRETRKRRIHGEIAATIGTGGTGAIEGSVDRRFGDHGDARISGEAVRGLPERPIRRNLDRR